jgi:hypothetical protein
MPVATDVLSDDIKEIKGELHQLGIGLAELRQEVKDAIALAKWVGTIFVATLLTGGVTAIVWGASLTTKVYGMESRGNEKFQEVGARADKLESRIEARFDRLEASIARALEQAKPPAPPAAKPNP